MDNGDGVEIEQSLKDIKDNPSNVPFVEFFFFIKSLFQVSPLIVVGDDVAVVKTG